MDDYKRNGQIPPFGNWEYAKDLPITQYFECARQAGLLRYSSSSGDSGDLYTPEFKISSNPRKTRGRDQKRGVHVKEQQRKQGKVCDVTEPPRRLKHLQAKTQPHKVEEFYEEHHYKSAFPKKPKAVDEDLYKIPPELLRTSKRSKMMGFFSRCLVPSCAA